jgi:serine/threonine protein kinase
MGFDNIETKKLLNDYLIIEQIGSGSFGEVYLAQYKNGGYVAVKVEEKKRAERVYNEYKIYKYLYSKDFHVGIPKTYDYLQSSDYNIMVMQLLGPSLEDLFNKYNRKFQLATVYKIGLQIVTLLEKLHKAGYIHRDIKPNNFLIGRDEGINQIHIMDFGLSKKYMVNGKHIRYRDKRSLIGTARYASVNMHMGFEPSRRDDLESVGYMLVYFLKGGLPWQGIRRRRKSRQIEAIGESKMCTTLEALCDGIPHCFREYIKYCRKLKFHETPDYDKLKGYFIKSSTGRKINPEFEWHSLKEVTTESHSCSHHDH